MTQMRSLLSVNPAEALCSGIKSSQEVYCKVHSLYVSSRLAEGLATAPDVRQFVSENWYEQTFRPVYTQKQTYGQLKESEALALYSEKTGLTVRQCKNAVNKQIPFLIASPDGLAFRQGQFVTAIEVKTIRNIRNYNGIRCCVYDGRRLLVRKQSNLYGQLQFTMAVFNIKCMDLVLYFPEKQCIEVVIVKRDFSYLSNNLTLLIHNYTHYLVPYLQRKLSELSPKHFPFSLVYADFLPLSKKCTPIFFP